jgi:hypothetical protein
MSCAFKNLFGEPGKGIRTIRIFNVSVVDLVLTIIAAYLIGRHYKLNAIGIFWIFCLLVLISVVVHEAFCVDTTLTKMLCQKL